MNTHSTIRDNALGEATTSDRVLQIALAAWRQGNFVEFVDQFDDQFTFNDHALGLEFKDKGRLTVGRQGSPHPQALAERSPGADCQQHRRKRHLPAHNCLADH
jgi:hypothetical protein